MVDNFVSFIGWND